MVDYIGKMTDDIPDDKKGESVTLVIHHLFDIAEYATKPSRTNADLFHHFVTQLLYLSERAHSDIQLTVSLLCTSKREPYTDDYNNLEMVI